MSVCNDCPEKGLDVLGTAGVTDGSGPSTTRYCSASDLCGASFVREKKFIPHSRSPYLDRLMKKRAETSGQEVKSAIAAS